MKTSIILFTFVCMIVCGCKTRRDDNWKLETTKADLTNYKLALNTFKRFHGRFPSDDEGLRALYIREVLPIADQDKWKGPYCNFERTDKDGLALDWWRRRLEYHAEGASIVLSSAGPDGVYGNVDDCLIVIQP